MFRGRKYLIRMVNKMKRKNIILKLSLSVFSLFLMLMFLELGVRIYKHEFRCRNFWLLERDFVSSAYPVQFDSRLGWIPKARASGKDNVWGSKVTISEDSIRLNGTDYKVLSNKPLILAVGDSFVFGDEVSDNETWPSYLEKKLGVRVVNGGVCGYGIDQSYIRLKKLLKKYNPDIILFGFTPDDIRRCGLSVYIRVPKPYFSINDNKLVLHDNHIAEDAIRKNDGVIRRVFGYSLFVHKVMRRIFPQYWLQGSWRSTKINKNEIDVAKAILKKLNSIADNNVKIYMVVQYLANPIENDYKRVENVLSVVDLDRVNIIDSRNVLNKLRTSDFNKFRSLYYKHMTSVGNKFMADIIYNEIKKREIQ